MPNNIDPQILHLGQEVARLYQSGHYKKALPLAIKCCELTEQYIGKKHPYYVTCLNNVAEIYRAMGRYPEAEPLYLEALEITRRNAGPNHPFVTRTLNNYAALKYMMGHYKEAASYYKEVLQILRINQIENNPDVANGKSGLAETYRVLGNYTEAEQLHKEALEIRRKIYNENHPDVGNSLHNLAELYRTMGRIVEAESLYRKALKIFEKTPQYYVVSLNGLSGLYKNMGKFVESESAYRRAHDIMCKIYGENSPNCATAKHNLAEFYRIIGNHKAALPLCQKALEVRRKVLDKNHVDLAASLITLALLYYDNYKFKEALEPTDQALKILRNALGENHLHIATVLDNKAVLYRALGSYKDVVQVYRQAQNIFSRTVGEKHPDFALSLLNMAGAYHEMGNYSEAEPLYRRAIEIYRVARGENHREFAFGLYSLARLMVATKNVSEAFSLVKKAAEIDDRMIGQIFSISSEQQRMIYLRDMQQNFDIFLSLVAHYFSESAEAVRSALDFVLRRKAIGAEALAAQRDTILGGRYPELQPNLKQLTTLRMQIATKTLAGPGSEGLEQHQKLLAEWNDQKEHLESELARQIPEMNLEQKLRAANRMAVAQILPEGVLLVEFVRFNVLDFQAIPAKKEPLWKPARYIAFVLPTKEPDNVQMLDLGEAEAIDQMIDAFRESIIRESERRGARDLGALPEKGQTLSTKEGDKLRATIFDPLLTVIGSCKRLLLAPDGDLTRLPFEVLPTGEGRCLIDDYHISYLSTGRDVLRFGATSMGEHTYPLVAADPNFDLGSEGTRAGAKIVEPRGRQSRDIRGKLHFIRLPGTREEGKRIAKMLDVKPWLEGTVLESKLKNIHSPRILHLATHGFFLEDQKFDLNKVQRGMGAVGWKSGTEISRLSGVGLENPLLRSGLAFAGANTWVEGGTPPEEAEDGILTAEDVSGLNLLTTELVVLSACDTGLGEIQTGEGVFGLRRAFVLAGAKTLVMSLWSVPDQQTQELMEDFYQRILSGQPRAEALREAQLTIKEKYPNPFYWGAFICQGDPSPLQNIEKAK